MTQLYRHFDRRDRLLYIGLSINAMHRGHGHKTKHWFKRVSKMLVENHPTREAAMSAERTAILRERPLFNRRIPIMRPKTLPRRKSITYTVELLQKIAKSKRRDCFKFRQDLNRAYLLKVQAKRLEQVARYLKCLQELNYQ